MHTDTNYIYIYIYNENYARGTFILIHTLRMCVHIGRGALNPLITQLNCMLISPAFRWGQSYQYILSDAQPAFIERPLWYVSCGEIYFRFTEVIELDLSWWRHQMEIFSALLAICVVPGEFPAQRPVTRSFDIFFELRLNKRLSEQSWGWWFETLLCPLWRHCNGGWFSIFRV